MVQLARGADLGGVIADERELLECPEERRRLVIQALEQSPLLVRRARLEGPTEIRQTGYETLPLLRRVRLRQQRVDEPMDAHGTCPRRVCLGKDLLGDGGDELGLVRSERAGTPRALRRATCLAPRQHARGERRGQHATQHESGAAQRFAPIDRRGPRGEGGGRGHKPVRADGGGTESGSGYSSWARCERT